MPTTDEILYTEVKRLRNECENLRKDIAFVIGQRDDARRDLQFSRNQVVQEQREKQRLGSEITRLNEIVTKQQRLISNAEDAQKRAEGARLTIFRERERTEKEAEAKIADIGWRKNRLVEAIEKRGFVVRWQKDGTPEVLTKEQAAERDKPKPKTSFYDYMNVLTSQALRDMDRSLIVGYPNKYGGLFSFTNVGQPPAPVATKPPVGAPEDTVIATKPTPEAKMATQNVTNLADALRPLYGPDGVYTRQLDEYYQRMREYAARKQGEVAAAEQASKSLLSPLRKTYETMDKLVSAVATAELRRLDPPIIYYNPLADPPREKVAQEYYDRAMKAVYGYVVSPLTWAGVLPGTIVRLDAALETEIRKGYSGLGSGPCPDGDNCPYEGCKIYQNRPWKRA